MCIRRLPLAIAPPLFFVLALAASLGPENRRRPSGRSIAQTDRIVAVGDVHGDVDRLLEVLRSADLVNEAGSWSGGDARLVLLGDLIDRGPRARDVLDLVMRLAREAPDRVHVLLGNHEVMNLTGDLRYVPPAEYRQYAGPESETLRAERWGEYARFLRDRAARLGFEPPEEGEPARRAWMAAHPAGFFERRAAFAPAGPYGAWLRSLDAARLEDGTLFVHGGVSEARTFPSVDSLNAEVRLDLARWDALWAALSRAGVLWPDLTWGEALPLVREELTVWEVIDSLPPGRVDPAALKGKPSDATLAAMREILSATGWAFADSSGPLWTRDLATDSGARLDAEVQAALSRYHAQRIVVGHTPTLDHRIAVRAAGRVFAIDTGLSVAMGGRASALEIRGSRIFALDPSEPHRQVWPAEAVAPDTVPSPVGPDTVPSPVAPDTVPSPTSPAPDSSQAAGSRYDAWGGLTVDQVERFLATAPVVATRPIGSGVTKPMKATLDDGAIRHDAAVQSVDTCEDKRMADGSLERVCDTWRHNVAAYRLAKILGLGDVVPSVERKFHGRPSAFTWWIQGAVTLAEVKARGLTAPDLGAWNRQQWGIGIFDELIYNTDRNQGNLLIDPGWRVWMIDHTRAFPPEAGLRNPLLLSKMHMDPPLLAHLRGLGRDALDACCARVLTKEERRALLVRRDSIVARFP